MVGKDVILDEKGNPKSKVTAGKTTKEFTQKAEYFSRGFRQNLMLAMNLAATAIAVAYRRRFEGKLRLRNSFDLYTVNNIFYLHKYLCVLLQDTGKYGKKVEWPVWIY